MMTFWHVQNLHFMCSIVTIVVLLLLLMLYVSKKVPRNKGRKSTTRGYFKMFSQFLLRVVRVVMIQSQILFQN